MSDSEVLLIKNYLQRIISTWKLFQPTTEESNKPTTTDTKNDEQTNTKSKYEVNYKPTINDTRFDENTRQAVIKIFQFLQLKHDCSQDQQHDGFIDKYDMELLKLLASGADLARDIEPFKKLIKENVEFYEGEIKGKFCQQCDCCFKKNGNISSNCLVLFLEKINEFDIPDYPVIKVQTYQGILCVFLYRMLENIEILILFLNDIITSENDIKKLKYEDFNRSIQEIGILISGILANKSHLVKFISSFTESLEIPDFSFKDYELTELTEITKSNILTLESFGFSKELSDKYSTILDIEIREILTKEDSEIKPILKKELPQILSRLKYLMGLLYTVCPPRIPESLFRKTEISISTPIPNIVNKLLINKLYELQPKNTVDNSSANKEEINLFLQENNDNQALPLLNGLDEILLQVLMPLGQYNNLSKAVEDGIVKIQSFLSKNTENSEKSKNKKNSEDNIREIIRETMRKYNVTIAQDYSLINEIYWQGWKSENFNEKNCLYLDRN
ncbi:hypothetical protein ACX27_20360 [Nostoc piscinale CENA21]|uniref:Uncharacterized protein n=1 Tax=Nostoc piscinale CENA21 TaxID=224013 RepID=A0A0M3V5X1_9NOSO|nr:hypothetical protein [Nostoc piscinale]ALF54653.1 hypothetical protein ACX27_20360 [Nostoc piscinale CENA21]